MIKDRTIENQKAVQKPAMLKPGTIFDASIINKAFITNEKNPKVKNVIGKVINFTTGLIKMFITPRTTARIIALTNVIVAPGIIYVAISMVNVEINKCVNIFMKVL